MIDLIFLMVICFAFQFIIIKGTRSHQDASSLQGFFFLLFLLKDGFYGFSPGKALLGVRVINEKTGKPIGVGSSFMRNLPLLIPLMPILVASELYGGYRTGDKWSASKVIWERYSHHSVFLKTEPRCRINLKGMDKNACNSLAIATKFEASGHLEEALKSYDKLIATYPDTQAAKDASISIERLRKRIQG